MTGIAENEEIQQEAKDMYASVKANGGFYIARYEAGKEGTDTVVSKKNATVWNNIPWSESDTMTTITGGAVEKARNFDTQHNYTSVTSTLCYGVQWDATMNFIDPKYLTGSCESDSFVKDSSGKGNYYTTGTIATGSNDNYQVNNIFDLGGNVYELTMESCYTDCRVGRGASYISTGSSDPASYREDFVPTGSYDYVGFRVTLFL